MFLRSKKSFGQRPKSPTSGRYFFTMHAEYKMREYHLSRQRVTRIIRSPKRIEEGIAENTVAVMQPASVKTTVGRPSWNQEIWVMYKVMKSSKANSSKLNALLNQPQIKIISAWRYPGVSPERDPIPSDILREIAEWYSMEEES